MRDYFVTILSQRISIRKCVSEMLDDSVGQLLIAQLVQVGRIRTTLGEGLIELPPLWRIPERCVALQYF